MNILVSTEERLLHPFTKPRRSRMAMQMRLRLMTVFVFLSITLLVGLGAVFAIQQGTAFLQQYHPPESLRRLATGTFIEPESLAKDSDAVRLQWKAGISGLAAGSKMEAMSGTPSSAEVRGFKGGDLRRSDLAAAFVTDMGHEDYTNFSRVWRQGIQVYLATNHSIDAWQKQTRLRQHNEHWGFYPDDKPLHTLALTGDSRAALAPFLAYRELGDSFKWMFYGDDDTFFFVDAALHVLQNLDHNLPYFLTDHLWWTEKWVSEDGNMHEDTYHPHRAAPLCAPCGYEKNMSGLPFLHPPGCPCTTATLCDADSKGIFFRGPSGQCGIPRVPIRTFSMHGGAGGILSIGLLRNISFKAFEDCVTTTYTTGGDAVITICLWQAGFGMTAPDPLWHPSQLHMFDVGREAQDDKEEIVPRVAHLMGNLLQAAAGDCTEGLCKLELENSVTLHMRSRKFPSKAAHAEVSRVLAALGDLAFGRTTKWAVEAKDADQRFINAQVGLALHAFQDWRNCQETKPGGVQKAVCYRANKSSSMLEQAGRTSVFSDILKKSSTAAASDVAAEIINQIFKRYPSATGAYGDIPIGRE